MAMAERLCEMVAQFLAEHDDRTNGQPAAGFGRARVATSLAEGLDGDVDGPRDRTAAADDVGRLAAFLDQGLPPPERKAVVATLALDAVCRAEATSAAAFLDGIDGAGAPVPAGLVARTVETFGTSPEPRQPDGRVGWSRSWLRSRIRRPSLVALVLGAVLTPVAFSVIWVEREVSVESGSGPIERSLTPSRGTDKTLPADRATAADRTLRSCEPNAAQSDQPAGDTKEPEARGAAPQPAPTSADDQCRPDPSVEGGRASTPPPAAGHK